MKKFFNKYFWTLLIVLAALGLAGAAAFFSISGLSKLFGGSALEVIIMASFIEFAKLVTTAGLHRYWKKTKWWMKYTLTSMVVAVMIITSSGIYGFLADAYASTSIQLDKIDGQITLIQKQQEQKKVKIAGMEEIKDSKSSRISSLISLRVQQETRIDSLYAKGWYSSAKKTQKLIDQSTEEIKSLQVELDSSLSRINRVNSEIGDLDIEILNLQNSDVATEIGPLKYMSTVLDKPMEDIINWFILMLIFVFDPLAVLLIIFASNVYDANNKPLKSLKRKEEEEVVEEEKVEEKVEEVVEEESDINKGNQKIIDAINEINPDSEILSFEHDFPEEKGEEVIEYIEGEGGNFEKTTEAVNGKLNKMFNGIESNPIYLSLLDILFLNGERKIGDAIPPIKGLIADIELKGIVYEKNILDNFLTICNLLSITDMSDKNNVKITMDYEQAKNIISHVSK